MQSRLAELKKARGDPEKGEVSHSASSSNESDSDSLTDSSRSSGGVTKKRRSGARRKGGAGGSSDSDAGSESDTGSGVNEDDLKDFFADVQVIKRDLGKIKSNVRTITELYDQQLMAVSLDPKDEATASGELEKLIDETNFAAQSVTNHLKRMDKENKLIPEEERGFASGRIRINMHGTLTKQFLDLMREYQTLQTDYKNRHRDNFERRYRMVKPEVTNEEIEEALESGKGGEIFAGAILDTRHAKAKEALAYVENKHRDIVRLEASIRELHQLFVDMAVLVEAQGELIDHIESNLESARDYTRKGVKELHKANDNQKKGRKNMCILGVCLLILIIVLALVFGLAGGLGGFG